MMKNIYVFLFVCVGVLFSCVEDKGNYIYTELDDVTINGIKENYIVEQFTHLKIEPQITVLGNAAFDPERYEYVWFFYTLSGAYDWADTLSLEKDLDVEITNIPDKYDLMFTMTDKQTGVKYNYQKNQVAVQVINSYSIGMMALSKVGDDANLTFINAAGSVIEDAYQKVNGEIAGKNPIGVCYVRGSMSQAEKMVVIMTDDGLGGKVVEPLDLSFVMNFRDLFYMIPQNVRPQAFGINEYTWFEYVINDGKLYTRTVGGYPGIDLYPKYGNRIKGDYENIAPFDFFDPLISGAAYFYDQAKEHFLYMEAPIQKESVVTMSDTSGIFDPGNMEMQMLWGGLFGDVFSKTNGRAVMEDHEGERYMISFKTGSELVFTPLAKIPLSQEGAKQAHTFTTSQNADFLYYGYSNKIACVSFTTGNLMNIYEEKEGNIDYLECDQVGNTKYMYVGISDGSAAKNSGSIVVFEMSTDGSLREVNRYRNVCGKVVDFEYKK